MGNYFIQCMDFFQLAEINPLVSNIQKGLQGKNYTLTRCIELVLVLESSNEITIHPGTYKNCANISNFTSAILITINFQRPGRGFQTLFESVGRTAIQHQ